MSGVLEIVDSEPAGLWDCEAEGKNISKPGAPPLACREILGQSVLERSMDAIQNAGIHAIWVVVPDRLSSYVREISSKYRGLKIFCGPSLPDGQNAWASIQNCAEQILVIRLGAYVEFNVPDLLRFHKEKQKPLVRARDCQGALDVWVASPTALKEATPANEPLFWERAPHADYFVNGYVNRLRNWNDFRDLAKDILLMRCAARPRGREIKPGIWMGEGARAHPRAKIIAPAYLGRHATIRAEALISQLSSVEQHCEIGRGTVVEDAAVLPYTRIGEGLHVSHAVVEENRFVCLRRGMDVNLRDPKFLSSTRRKGAGDTVTTRLEHPMPEVAGMKPAFPLGTALPRVLGFLKDEI